MLLAAYYHVILAVLFGFMAIFLMVVILLQRGRGVGLSGAFGGAGGHTAFGAKTGDVLTWATIVIAALLLTFAVVLNYIFVPPPPFATPPPPLPPVTPLPAGATESPAESAPPPGPPVSPEESPEGSWHPGERASWPQYARQVIFGTDLG